MNLITSIDPRLKLAWVLAGIATAFLVTSLWAELLLIGITFALQWFFCRNLRYFKVLAIVILVVFSQLLIIQLLFNREGILLYEWWIFNIYSGAIPAAIMGTARTAALAFLGVQFISWTSPLDATLMLKSFGIPYRYAMLVGIAARFFPVMRKEYTAITQSQAVRGLPTHGLGNKIKALPPTLFPLLYRAMGRSADTALSMELRGFGREKERTFTKTLKLTSMEKMALLLLLAYTLTLTLVQCFA